MKEEKHKKERAFKINIKVLMIRGSHKGSNRQGTKYVEVKCRLNATDGFFIADLIACSTCFGHHYAHHQELKSIIQWLLPVVFSALVFKLLVWCGALRDAAYRSAIKTSVASSWHFISTY